MTKSVILCIDVIRIILDYLSELTQNDSVWRYYIDSRERMLPCLNYDNPWVRQLSMLFEYKSNNLPFTHPLVLRFAYNYDNDLSRNTATTVVLSNWSCSTTLGPTSESIERTYTISDETYIYMDFSKSVYDVDYLNVTSRGTVYDFGDGPYAITSGSNLDQDDGVGDIDLLLQAFDELWFKPNVASLLWVCPIPNVEYSVMHYIDTECMSTWSDLEQRWISGQ